LAGTVPLANK
nr:RecName: Full=Unknown protein 2 [Capsicum chinense]